MSVRLARILQGNFQQLNEIGMDIIYEEDVSGAQRIASNFKIVREFTGRLHHLGYRLNSNHL